MFLVCDDFSIPYLVLGLLFCFSLLNVGEIQMENGKWKVGSGKWKVGNEGLQIANTSALPGTSSPTRATI